MYDVDMTKIETALDSAFNNEVGVSFSAADVVRLRRYMQSLKQDLRTVCTKHLELLNNSVPITDVVDLRKAKEELTLLEQKISSIEYAGKLGSRAVCPNCYSSGVHEEDCWVGVASRRAKIK